MRCVTTRILKAESRENAYMRRVFGKWSQRAEMKDKSNETEKEKKSIEWSVWCPVGHYFELLVLRTFWKLYDRSSVRAVHWGTKGGRKNVFINSGPISQAWLYYCMCSAQGPTGVHPEMSEKLWSGNEREVCMEAWNKVVSGCTEGKEFRAWTEVFPLAVTGVKGKPGAFEMGQNRCMIQDSGSTCSRKTSSSNII